MVRIYHDISKINRGPHSLQDEVTRDLEGTIEEEENRQAQIVLPVFETDVIRKTFDVCVAHIRALYRLASENWRA